MTSETGPPARARGAFARAAALVVTATLTVGCGPRGGLGAAASGNAERVDHGGATAEVVRARTGSTPAGTTCQGRDDCAADHVCVGGRCRYRKTSVAGEVLAAAARAQLEGGDAEGAAKTFAEAIAAYEAAGAPVPGEVLCGSAMATLRAARTDETREEGARRADACFRGSLPGERAREEVTLVLSRLRYDGLDLARYDRPSPADRFFAGQPTRPTSDAIDIAIDFPERGDPGYSALRDALRGETAMRTIADCFVQDWELRHERQAAARLVLKFSTRMREYEAYDVYEPTIEVLQTTPAVDGFEPCLAAALPSAIGPGPRNLGRTVHWQVPFEVAARLQ